MDIFNRYKKLIVITVVAVVAIVLVFSFYRYVFTFYVSSVTPGQSQTVSFLTPAITFNFNKDINPDSIELVTPDELVTSYTVNENVLNINIFSGLEINQKYEFSVKSVTSTGGLSLEDYSYSFTTDDSTTLSDVEQQLILQRQQENKPDIMNDPVLAALPYFTDEFYLESLLDGTSDGVGRVSVNATIFLTREQSRTDRLGSIEAIKKRVVEYLNTIDGFTVSDYEILYVVQEP